MTWFTCPKKDIFMCPHNCANGSRWWHSALIMIMTFLSNDLMLCTYGGLVLWIESTRHIRMPISVVIHETSAKSSSSFLSPGCWSSSMLSLGTVSHSQSNPTVVRKPGDVVLHIFKIWDLRSSRYRCWRIKSITLFPKIEWKTRVGLSTANEQGEGRTSDNFSYQKTPIRKGPACLLSVTDS